MSTGRKPVESPFAPRKGVPFVFSTVDKRQTLVLRACEA